MIKALLLSTLLNPEFSESRNPEFSEFLLLGIPNSELQFQNPEFSELRIEARRRSKGNKKRRRGGNGLR